MLARSPPIPPSPKPQAYVYGGVPPETAALKFTGWPKFAGLGVAVIGPTTSAGATCTVAFAVPERPALSLVQSVTL